MSDMKPGNVIGRWFTPLLIINVYYSLTTAKYKLELSPEVKVACTNQTVKFTCRLFNPPEQPTDKIGFEVLKGRDIRPVEEKELLVINETMSKFEYRVSAGADYRYLRCNYGNSSSEPKAIIVYTMPEEVKDFSCIVYNYVESMRCNWSYGIEYNSLPDVVFQWKDKRWKTWQTCRNLSVNPGSCHWISTKEDGDFTMKNISIRITLMQTCGKNVTSSFDINTSKIVKPESVMDLQATVLNTTCIRLYWKTTRSEYPKQHLVNILSKWKNWAKNFSTEEDINFVNETCCNLHPYTAYTFSVCVKPPHGGYCSDVRSVSATTLTTNPSASPLVTPGGYTWHSRDCERDSTERNVCLLWKPIKEADRNGGTGNVHVSFVPEVVNITTLWPGSTSFGCILLPCGNDYTAYIKAQNTNGTSVNASELKVLGTSAGIEKPEFIVELLDTTNDTTQVHISLLDSNAISQYGYTVFWCRLYLGHCNKNSPVEWKRSNQTETVFNINAPEDHVYGVSMTSQHGGSGLEWQSCLYTKERKPTREPKNVHVEAVSDENSLVVTWDKLTCESSEPYISSYHVEYCTVPGDQNCKNKTVPAIGKAMIMLKNLIEDQTYAITVRGISKDKRKGPKSKPKHAIPGHNSMNTGLPLAWIISGVILCVVVTLSCFMAGRFWKKRVKNWLEDAGRITIPAYPEELDNKVQRYHSNDSGYSQSYLLISSDTEEIHPLTLPEGNAIVRKLSYVRIDEDLNINETAIRQEMIRKTAYQEESGISLQTVADQANDSNSIAVEAFQRNTKSDKMKDMLPVPFEFRNDSKKLKKNISFSSPYDLSNDSRLTASFSKVNDRTCSDKIPNKVYAAKSLINIASQTLSDKVTSSKTSPHAVYASFSNSYVFSGEVKFDYVKPGGNDTCTHSELSEHEPNNSNVNDYVKSGGNDTCTHHSELSEHEPNNSNVNDYVKPGGNDTCTHSELSEHEPNNSNSRQSAEMIHNSHTHGLSDISLQNYLAQDNQLDITATGDHCFSHIISKLPVPIAFDLNRTEKAKVDCSDTHTPYVASVNHTQNSLSYPPSKTKESVTFSRKDVRYSESKKALFDAGEVMLMLLNGRETRFDSCTDSSAKHTRLPVPTQLNTSIVDSSDTS